MWAQPSSIRTQQDTTSCVRIARERARTDRSGHGSALPAHQTRPDRAQEITSYCLRCAPSSVVVLGAFSHTGCTNAPLPAVSHTANRTHDLPVASNGIAKRLVPNAPRSVAEIVWRSTFLPSPHTTSTNDNGNVHPTSAPIDRLAPVPATE